MLLPPAHIPRCPRSPPPSNASDSTDPELTMYATGGHRPASALRSAPAPVASTLNHFDLFGSRLEKIKVPLQLHSLAQRFSPHHFEPSPAVRPLSPASTNLPTRTTNKAGFAKRNPRHKPILITDSVIQSVLRDLPPSPRSLENSPEPSGPATQGSGDEGESIKAEKSRRPRHIPIVIPYFAQPRCTVFPPTPSTSADTTPRASPKPYSCEPYYSMMARPTTSDSQTSTFDSNVSAPSPNQIYTGRFKPSSSTYLADMNSSSESSLNHPGQGQAQESQPTSTDAPLRNIPEAAQSSTEGSPKAGPQNANTNGGTTNLSGLVCNVHKCTGREPLARVGATTTILGDKLYVFGGRILSRKQAMKVTSDMYELDLIRRHWTRVETSGSPPKPRYFHTMCTLGDTKLICYGGMSPAPSMSSPPSNNGAQPGADPMENMMVMSDIHVYDTVKRTWTYIATSETPPGRYAHCAAVVPSLATFTSANAPLSAILHNPPSSIPNQGSLGVSLDGTGGAEMIVVGGQDSHNKYIDAISVFNLRNLKWTHTQPLERSCGAYRSVVTPLSSMPAAKIGSGPDREDGSEGLSGEKSDATPSMLIYSNYNFLDVKLELQARLSDGSLIEKEMTGAVSPPGLRFPSGDILDNHFIVSGTYLTSSKHEYALWALDLKTLTWSRIDAGGGIFSQGSWNRGVLWARRNTFVILGNRKRVLVDDYNRRRINFSNICMVELEAFGLYDNPRRAWPTSNYPSISAPVLPASITNKPSSLGGRLLTSAAIDLGLMAMKTRDLADMDLLAIGGERLAVNSYLLARRWGPYFIQLLRDSGSSSSIIQNDASSSSDGGTLRPGHLNPSSATSRNSSITITPSVTTTSTGASSLTVNSTGTAIFSSNAMIDPPTPQTLPASSRPRQLYLPHTHLTLRAMVYFLYTSSLPPSDHELCTPQILCSLLQLARPYRIDGLLEATVERLHQALDGRNAAAVFNAAAMAAGGGRGTGTPFGKEGELDPVDDLQAGSLTIRRLQARHSDPRTNNNSPYHNHNNNNHKRSGDTSEDSEESTSGASSNPTSSESASEAEMLPPTAGAALSNGGHPQRKVVTVGAGDEVWAGGVSCVVGLQKRGLRGLMEGRRMRERERGRAVGGFSVADGGGGGGQSNGVAAVGGGGGGGAVGLGIGGAMGMT